MSSNPGANDNAAQRDSSPATATYSRVFRIIGQDVAGFFPRTLEITTHGENFEVQGQCHPNPFEAIKETFLNRIWRRVARRVSAPGAEETQPPACFARTYDAAELDQLDHLYSANRRADGSRRADAYSLSERLRTMGAIVDKRNGSLKRLHKEADRFSIEYWDAQGQLQSANLTTVIFYRNQQHADPRRHKAPAELWEGYDF